MEKGRSCIFALLTIMIIVYGAWEVNHQLGYNTRGMNLVEKGQYGRAIEMFTKALERDGKDAEALMNRGITNLLLGKPNAALADLNAALELDSKLPVAYSYRALARFSKGDSEGAISDADMSVKLAPLPKPEQIEKKPGRTARGMGSVYGAWANTRQVGGLWSWLDGRAVSYANRSIIRRVTGDTAGAIADCDTVLALDPECASIHLLRGLALEKKGDSRGARADVAAYTKAHPEMRPYVDSFAEWPSKKCTLSPKQLSLFLDPPSPTGGRLRLRAAK